MNFQTALQKVFIWFFLCVATQASFGQKSKAVKKQKILATDLSKAIYKDAGLPVNQRVKDLLSRMTLEEKIGQMTQLCASSITLDGTKNLDLNLEKIRGYIKNNHIGSFLSGTGKAQRWVDFVTGIQKVAITETRLGIPIIFGMDNVHGSDYTDEATILPHNLNLACTFNTTLAADAAKVTAIESADLGHIWNFAPVLDVGKNPIWPRLYETFGEDPLVCARMGATFTQAFQNCPEVAPYQLAACAKHFIGYSDPKSGWDRTPSEIPDQILREFFMPPFEAAFKAGIKTLMVNSGELNGEPVHGSKKILNQWLRKEMGFEGVIVTDIKDINKIVTMHGGAADEKEATLKSIEAGIDVSMACSDVNFCRYMLELHKEGKISTKRIDESVSRILKLKFELGLFENPYPRADRLNKIGAKEHYTSALKAAEESLVLLKNEDGILPFKPEVQKILLAGFAANSKRNLNGAWTFEWLGAPENRQPSGMLTLFDALKLEMPNKEILLADSNAETPNHPARKSFLKQAEDVDAIVLTIGETPYSEFKGNINDLKLNDNQISLVKDAIQTGRHVVLLYIGGRPRLVKDLLPKTDAFIFCGHPGVAAGEAIAKVLSGKVNPSGRLPFSWPSESSHWVPYYHKKSDKYQPLFSFGSGFGYSSFLYSNLTLSDTVLSAKDFKPLKVQCSLENNSHLSGAEVALWYLTDEVGTITRPVKKLVHFEKVSLNAGKSTSLNLSISLEDLSYPDEKGNRVLEPGFYTLTIGSQKARFRLK